MVRVDVEEAEVKRSSALVLAIVSLAHFIQHIGLGIPVLYASIMADLGLTYTEIGLMAGASFITSGFLQLVFSVLSRYTSRRILLGLGGVLISLSETVMGLANRFSELVVGKTLQSIGSAPVHPIGASTISEQFDKKHVSTAFGVFYGLAFIGNVVSPLILIAIALTWGWRSAMFVLAIPSVVTGLAVLVFLRKAEFISQTRGRESKTSLWRDIKSSLKLRGAPLTIAIEAFMSGGAGMGVIVTYMPLFLENELHLEQAEMSVIYSIAMLGGVVGATLIGHVGDRLGHLRISIASTIAAIASVFLLLAHASFSWIVVPHLFIVGLVAFPGSLLMQAYISSMARRLTTSQRELLFGLYFTIGFSMGSVWSTLIGFMIDTYNSFAPAWLTMTILGVVALSLQIRLLLYLRKRRLA